MRKPEPPPGGPHQDHAFWGTLRGQKLTSICLVGEELYLDFFRLGASEDSHLDCVVWPEVQTEHERRVRGEPGYFEALHGFSGRTVSEARLVEGEYFLISFEPAGQFRISLRDEDRRGPETVVLTMSDEWSHR